MLVHGEFEADWICGGLLRTEADRLRLYPARLGAELGSRCVRPPIIYADIARPKAMTVRELGGSVVHGKPVKRAC